MRRPRFSFNTRNILLLAFVTRLLWAILVPMHPVSDGLAYDTLARSLAAGTGYSWEDGLPTAFWPVGTSASIAACYLLFGIHYWGPIALNLLVGLAVVYFSMALALRWFNAGVGLWTGLLLALWPMQIEFTTILSSELLFQALILAAIWIWTGTEPPTWRRTALAGIALGLGALVRPLALLVPGLFLLFKGRRSPRRVLLSALTMLLVIAPWTLRNQQALGAFVPISDNFGYNLWFGNHPGSNGGYTDELPDWVAEMNEVETNRALQAEAVRYIREEPLVFFRQAMKRLVQVHGRESIGVAWNQQGLVTTYGEAVITPLKLLSSAYWWVILALSGIGICLLTRRHGLTTLQHPTVLFWGYFAAIHAVMVGGDRYHMPSSPFIGMLAALALSFILSAGRRGHGPGNLLQEWSEAENRLEGGPIGESEDSMA